MLLNGEKIIITGTNGFIGRNLAKRCSLMGAKIYGIGHGNFSKQEMIKNGISCFISASVNLSNLKKLCKNPNRIIHCASGSSVPFSINYPKLDFEKSVNSTLSILEFMRLYAQKSKLVIPSSAAVYGEKKNKAISIKDSTNPLSPYGNNKKIIEDLCNFYASYYKLEISIIRFFSLYGPGLKKQLLWDACNKARSKDDYYYGTGLETRDWLNIKDAISLIILASEKASNKVPIVNGGTGKGVTNKEILFYLYKKLEIENFPKFSGQTRRGDPLFFEADIKETLSWDWEPLVNWKDGINEYVNWYKKIIK